MQTATRTALSFVPLLLQGLAALLGIITISFFLPAVVGFLKTHEGKLTVPGPTRLLVEHPGAAKMIVLGLFAFSVITFFITRSKMKEEADRLAVQSAVNSIVWYAGIVYIGGVLMAAALPYFILNSQ